MPSTRRKKEAPFGPPSFLVSPTTRLMKTSGPYNGVQTHRKGCLQDEGHSEGIRKLSWFLGNLPRHCLSAAHPHPLRLVMAVPIFEGPWQAMFPDTKLFLDASRLQIRNHLFDSFAQARRWGHWGDRGLNAVVGGPHDCGKTTFLKALVKFVQDGKVTANARAFYFDCSAVTAGLTLPSVFADRLGFDDAPVADASVDKQHRYIRKKLKTENLLLFIVLDEFHELYKLRPEGDAIVRVLACFNNKPAEHRLRFVVTGSSAVLRSLCFASLPAALRSDYPGYTAISLNSSKAIWLPLTLVCDANEFPAVLRTAFAKCDAVPHAGSGEDDGGGKDQGTTTFMVLTA